MRRQSAAIAVLAGALLAGGCATNSAVDQRIAELEAKTDQKIESVATQVEDLQEAQRNTDQRLESLSREASEALRRAEEAGVLARGQVVFEQSFTEDKVRFQLGSAQLSSDAQVALDDVAAQVRALNRPVFIEIQGHTDSTGSERYNQELGQDRAESVRRYLSQRHGIPLARMSTISYGESMPAVPNSTRDGRMQNRRVVIVVLE
ncbi:MAG TPA: OmpA family protein [Thermoanaerobaculia bacterium]|nr:OmpA family protein [Thermoanaerobaculia bacterium]